MTARQVERTWLVLIALSFGLGGLAIFLFPSLSEGIYTVGVCTNLVMAVAMGVFVGWTRNWRKLGLAVFSGACLTVVGSDLLEFVLPGASPNAAWDLLFSAIATCVAVAGMSILVGGAAVATVAVRGVVRHIGNKRGCRLGHQVSQRFANCVLSARSNCSDGPSRSPITHLLARRLALRVPSLHSVWASQFNRARPVKDEQVSHLGRDRHSSRSVLERSKRAHEADNGRAHQGGRLAAALVASAGVFVATLLVGPAAVAYPAASGRVVSVATNTAGAAIKVGDGPGAIAITRNGKTAYVANLSSGTVTPISTATNEAGPAIKVGDEPWAIAITPNGKTAYVANLSSGTVTPISTATNEAGPPIKVGNDPWAIAITPNGKTAYVLNKNGDGTVTPITTSTNTARPAIKVGNEPAAISITPNSMTAYVANEGSDTVTPISTATDNAGPAIDVGVQPSALAITPSGKTAYVVNQGFDTVTPISTAANKAGPAIKVGGEPWAIAITPDGKTAYVVDAVSETVTPISTATNEAGPAIKVGGQPHAIAITPNGKTAYVANWIGPATFTPISTARGSVSPISTDTNKAGPAIKVGNEPGAIAITPNGKTAYVANLSSGTVTPIST